MDNIDKKPLLVAIGLALLAIISNLYYRPLLPIDETRYISVAWEMWQSNSWLNPLKNGEFYSHKPPGLFWLIHLFWAVFGVSENAARLAVPLLTCLNYVLVAKLAKQIYPNQPRVASYSPLVLASFSIWLFYVPALMFDLLLSVTLLACYLNLYRFAAQGQDKPVLYAGLSLGIGMLIKGPVMFVYVLPMMLSYRWWRQQHMIAGRPWQSGCVKAAIVGIMLILCWAIPAAIHGGEAFARAIFWQQSIGRMNDSFAHARPFYWYLPLLPLLLLPWPLLGATWRKSSWRPLDQQDRLLLLVPGTVLVIFSLISGKQLHYLLPMLPLIAILLAAKFDFTAKPRQHLAAIALFVLSAMLVSSGHWLGNAFKQLNADNIEIHLIWALLPACAGLLLLMQSYNQRLPKFARVRLISGRQWLLTLSAFSLGIMAIVPCWSPLLFQAFDVTPTAQYIRQLQQNGKPLVFVGRYHSQYQFAGRLQQPLATVEKSETALLDWAAKHPDGFALLTSNKLSQQYLDLAIFRGNYRDNLSIIVPGKALTELAIAKATP